MLNPDYLKIMHLRILNGDDIRTIARNSESLIGVRRGKSWVHRMIHIYMDNVLTPEAKQILQAYLAHNKRVGQLKGGQVHKLHLLLK